MDSLLILSTGGTFNKIYNRKTGTLDIDSKAQALHTIAKNWLCNFKIETLINKDSLDFSSDDRKSLVDYVEKSPFKKIVIVHGTDTLHLSAQAVAAAQIDKVILFTGAMVPFSINPIEATANLASAIGYAQATNSSGVYISINGKSGEFSNIVKNREQGYFEYC